jgi:hypothetical protein
LIWRLAGDIAKGWKELAGSGIGFPEFSDRYGIKAENTGDPYDMCRKKPLGGNPNAQDLVEDYWFSSREETKNFLTGRISDSGFELESEVCGPSK